MLRLHYWVVAVWVGAAVMAFELAGARLLMPLFGAGVDVWAIVIAACLGALSLGYWTGGRIADWRPGGGSLGAAMLLGGVGMLVARWIARASGPGLTELPPVGGAASLAGLTLVLPMAMLGAVQPILARLLIRDTARTGHLVGGLLAAGTLGGVAGAIFTGLCLIPHLGVAGTLAYAGGGTCALAVISLLAGRRTGLAAAGTLAAAAALSSTWWPMPRTDPPGTVVLERIDGLYGDLEILERHGARLLLCDGICQTMWPALPAGLGRGDLIRGGDWTELIPYLRPRARTALLIGMGGGLHEAAMRLYGINVQAVELDPAVVELAGRHFGFGGPVAVMDGRAYLARCADRYDAVILDAFVGSSVPEQMFTQEAFGQIARCLADDGVLVTHLIAPPDHPATRAVVQTIQTVFPHTLVAGSGLGRKMQHLYIFASREPLSSAGLAGLAGVGAGGFLDISPGDGPLLTDDRTCLNVLARDIVTQIRRNSLATRRDPTW